MNNGSAIKGPLWRESSARFNEVFPVEFMNVVSTKSNNYIL